MGVVFHLEVARGYGVWEWEQGATFAGCYFGLVEAKKFGVGELSVLLLVVAVVLSFNTYSGPGSVRGGGSSSMAGSGFTPASIAGTRLRGACGSFSGLVGSLSTGRVRGVRAGFRAPNKAFSGTAASGRVVSR